MTPTSVGGIWLTASLPIRNLPAQLRCAFGAAVELTSRPATRRSALQQPRPDWILPRYGELSRRPRLTIGCRYGRRRARPPGEQSKARAPVTFVCPHTGLRTVMGSILARKNVRGNHGGYSETDQFSDQFSSGRYVIVTEGR